MTPEEMAGLPTQQELDAVAHFVEAARQLHASPFFVEEYRSLSISARTGDPKDNIQGHFPDPNVLRGALVPFRRLWHQNEPCHFETVAKILKRYVPEFRAFLDPLALDDGRSVAKQLPWFRDISLSLRDVINVWLNVRYHHVGKSSRRGRFTREDFDELSEKIGPVLFEFYFLSAVHEAGIAFFNILGCAESFLRGFAKHGLEPSFAWDTRSSERNVERVTPGFTPPTDTPEQRVWRLRRRQHYAGFNAFLDLTNCSDINAVTLVSQCASFDDCAKCLGIVLGQVDELGMIEKEDCTYFGGCVDNYATAARNQRSRRGFVAQKKNGELMWGEDYVAVLRDQYLEFRQAFQKETFE